MTSRIINNIELTKIKSENFLKVDKKSKRKTFIFKFEIKFS